MINDKIESSAGPDRLCDTRLLTESDYSMGNSSHQVCNQLTEQVQHYHKNRWKISEWLQNPGHPVLCSHFQLRRLTLPFQAIMCET